MAGNTHVPDKLEGYMLQVRHALFELISVDDRIVSVESYDDVAVETDDTIIAEQAKSVLSSNNPIANRAEPFWKTIYNWCNYIKNGELPEKELVLKYVVVSSHDVKAGSIPGVFAKAKNGEEAKVALETARKELLGDATEKKAPISQSLKPYIDFFFAKENEAFVVKVITALQIDIHEDSYDEKLMEKFKRQPIPQEYATELFESMLGWVNDQVHQQTKQNKPAYISSKDYRSALELQIRSRDCKVILHAVSVRPDDCTTTAEVERHDTYIKQLELIGIGASDIFEAASDFLRTRVEKTAWAEKGLVNEGSFSDYYDGLRRFWKNQKFLSRSISTDDIDRGQYVYAQCLIDASTRRLLGIDVPSFFGSGSLQALANEPTQQPSIGWHPRYIDLLKGDEEQNE